MPVSPQNYQRVPLGGDPIHNEMTGMRRPTGFLVASYWPADTNNDRWIRQGALLAEVTGGVAASSMSGSQSYYVPYSPTAAYGTGSDTCVGILREDIDATLSDWQIAPVSHGTAYTSRCYVPGGALGDIPAAAQTDLTHMGWR